MRVCAVWWLTDPAAALCPQWLRGRRSAAACRHASPRPLLSALHHCTYEVPPPPLTPPLHPPPTPLPTLTDLMLFTLIADVSILTLNLSLMLNTVSFYQVRAWG